MRFDVESIKQAVQLLAREGHGVVTQLRPMEAMLLESFVVKAKAIVFPEQYLNAIMIAVGKHIEFF